MSKIYFISKIKEFHITYKRINLFDVDDSYPSLVGDPRYYITSPKYYAIINDELILFLRFRFGKYKIDDYNLTIIFEDSRDFVEYEFLTE